MFSLKKNEKPISGITINGTTTVASPSAKYLDMHLNKKLLYSKHINKTRIKIGKLTGRLYCLINRKSTLTTQNKLRIYKTIIKPVTALCCTTVEQCSKYTLTKNINSTKQTT